MSDKDYEAVEDRVHEWLMTEGMNIAKEAAQKEWDKTHPPPTTTEEASDEYMRGFEAGCAFVMAGNEEKRSRPPTVVVPQDKVESADLTGKTMSAYPYAFTNNDGILVFRAEFLVCEPCVLLKGEECHTPECVFCFQPVSVAKSVLNKTLNCPIIDGERIILLPHTQDTKTALRGHSPELSLDSPASSPDSE